MTTYLGVDAGEHNYGIAVANGPLATPLPAIHSDNISQITNQLIKLASQYSASVIILGLPSGKISSLVQKLKTQLQNSSQLKVILHSESLSTYDAINKLREIGAKRKKLQNDHSYAACLILEDYLESIS